MTLDKMSVSTKMSLINQQKRQTHFFGKSLSLLGPLVPLISFYLFGLKIKISYLLKEKIRILRMLWL
jgi:hypothetical protein